MKTQIKILLLISLLFSGNLFAQKLQFGLLAKISAPQLLIAEKNFDQSNFKYIPAITSGLGVGGNYYFGRKLNLYFGFNLQLKSYAARLYNFDVANIEGFISYRPMFASLEMPIVLNYEKKRKKENKYINYGAGVVLSYTKPLMTTVRQRGPLFSDVPERDTLLTAFNSNLDKAMYFSYDLYAGVKFVTKIKKRRLYEWGISYQHAFKKSSKLSINGYVNTFNDSKNYDAVFNPKLSSFTVHIIFYPRHFIVL